MLNISETGNFGVSRKELQWIILAILKQSPRHKCAQKPLFRKVLNHMEMKPRLEARANLLKIFCENLQILKEQGKIKFYSAKVKTYVVLNEQD